VELRDKVFTRVLGRLADHGLIKGERIGVDASTIEANAALRAIVRRDSGKGYREMLTRMACESGIETPTADDLVRLDRTRNGKKLSNIWQSRADPDARIAKVKDGRTHLGVQAGACDGPRHRCGGRGRTACRRSRRYRSQPIDRVI
jgi:transposase